MHNLAKRLFCIYSLIMKDHQNSYKFFIYFSIFWITVGWGIYLLALTGLFYWWSISILIALISSLGGRFVIKSFPIKSKNFIVFNLFFIITATVFVYFSSPTIFSGRDQASISQAAIRLSQNGQLSFSNSVSEDFFNINNIQKEKTKNCLIDNLNDFNETNFLKLNFYHTYCQALNSTKAFNFPGFYYTNEGQLVTQFPLVYITWLALFYSFFGLKGFAIANLFLIYFFFLTSYFLIEKIIPRPKSNSKRINQSQIISFTLLASSFCLMWFAKFTLTENMATTLLWVGILSTLSITESEKKLPLVRKQEFWLFFLSFGLLIFTRIEGIVFFIFALATVLLNKKSRLFIKNNLFKLILPIIAVLLFVFCLNVFSDIYFYKSILKATLENIQESQSKSMSNNKDSLGLFKIFGLYGLLIPLIFGTIGIFYLLIKSKDYQKLIPLIIISPSLIYLVSPQITPEHPWMLRRFTFSILPTFLIYSSFLIFVLIKKKKEKIAFLILIIILISNLVSWTKYLTFIPNKNLLQETQELSQNFSNKDLILVDQLASGDKFEMIADPLNSIFGKNAVYFFNPQDLVKINKDKYAKIYLIAPDSKIDYYQKTTLGKDMFFVKKYNLELSNLSSVNPYSLPQKKFTTFTGSIFEIIK